MNDIKKKKQEVLAKMKPVWDEEARINKEYKREIWEEKKNQIKCYFTYPWGHIYGDLEGSTPFEYRQCGVCGFSYYIFKNVT